MKTLQLKFGKDQVPLIDAVVAELIESGDITRLERKSWDDEVFYTLELKNEYSCYLFGYRQAMYIQEKGFTHLFETIP